MRLDHGPAIDAILASAAIPGVFPPVTIEGRTFIDGGIVDDTPISQAIAAGATDVWVLSTGYSCALPTPPKTPPKAPPKKNFRQYDQGKDRLRFPIHNIEQRRRRSI